MNNHFYDTLDREYLAELIKYFPVSPPITIEQATRQIQDNSQAWDSYKFIEILGINTPSSFRKQILTLPNLIHILIFDGILNNAGSYRYKSDINEGHVEFGLPVKKFTDGAGCSSSRFSGADPFHIGTMVDRALNNLIIPTDDSKDRAAKFYQQFVKIRNSSPEGHKFSHFSVCKSLPAPHIRSSRPTNL